MLLIKVIRHFLPWIVNIINLELSKFQCKLNLFLDLDQIALSGLDKQGMCRDLVKPCVREIEKSLGRGQGKSIEVPFHVKFGRHPLISIP